MIFPVLEKDECRMLELNFIEEYLLDKYKDHVSRSYHFTMIKQVTEGKDENEFTIEFNNSKFTYKAVVQNQRDFIVGIIRTAIEETQIFFGKNRGVNCPDNHNKMKKEERDRKKIAMNVKENCLKLKIIRDDFVLPPKSLKIGECRKKNQTFGKEKRYIMLGTS
jgi:hypothetical protein